jgi:hypothetical protein
MSERDPVGPKIPIPGAPGAAIFAALMRLATHCGDASVTIRKERLPAGGYTYLIATDHSKRS